jgi:hypothetical protein
MVTSSTHAHLERGWEPVGQAGDDDEVRAAVEQEVVDDTGEGPGAGLERVGPLTPGGGRHLGAVAVRVGPVGEERAGRQEPDDEVAAPGDRRDGEGLLTREG